MFALVFICSTLGLVVLSAVLFRAFDRFDSALAMLTALATSVCAGLALIAGLCLSYDWFAAEHKARILNAEYGTNYSQQDVFFASSVIETVRQLDRKRIELNGDLMRDKADK